MRPPHEVLAWLMYGLCTMHCGLPVDLALAQVLGALEMHAADMRHTVEVALANGSSPASSAEIRHAVMDCLRQARLVGAGPSDANTTDEQVGIRHRCIVGSGV